MIEPLEQRFLLASPFDVLVFSRTAGFRHDSIAAGTQAIRDLGTANSFNVVATEDPAAFNDANLAQFEAVVFLLTTGDVLNITQQSAFERYIANGNGYVGIHSAADTEYGWSFYGGLVGAYFSNHPAIQQATIKVADTVHPATAGLPQRWVRTDEWYNYQANPRGRVHVLATLDETTYSAGAGAMGFDHPIAWTQEFGGGRSFYTGLGHTIASYSEPFFRQHLLGGIRYAAGAVEGDSGPTVNTNFQKVVLDADTLDPMQLDVAPNGRVFYVERGGAVKVWSPLTSSTTTIGNIAVTTLFEDGLLGLALDPNFASNQWLYLFYSAVDANEQRVSRFTLVGNQLDLGSEKIMLRIPVQRTNCCHAAGSLDFGPDGTLYIATGDNTNPFESDGFAPIDERAGRSDWDAQKSSANTNDLRGKILRIKPEPDGTYSIPAGNLFPANGSQGRPEIFVMGNRNPFRISVDSETGWLYWGEVGPDANGASPTRGPMGHDEFNQARGPGNYGWPYFVANNQPYNDYNFATGTSGPLFNPAAPINNSPNNTGAQQLPAAKGAWIWYPYAGSTTFPELGAGGRTAMAGPVYHYNPQTALPNALPGYYDDTLFIYEWSRNWIKEVKIDQSGNVLKINPFLPNLTFQRPMDMKIGPDGVMYMIEWGSGFGGGNSDSQLIRIDYVKPRLLAATVLAQATSGRSVELSWNDNSHFETGYKIERRQPGGAFVPLNNAAANATSYRDDTLSPGTLYEYRIRSFAGLNNSPFSELSSVRTWITGDLNGDGSVSIADFLRLSGNFNMPGQWGQGDLNADGTVTIADFLALAGNFGATAPAAPQAAGPSEQSAASSAPQKTQKLRRHHLKSRPTQSREVRATPLALRWQVENRQWGIR
jgi:glucose/arabinose dehydrogenase